MEANPRRMCARNESIVAAAWAPEAERRRGTALRRCHGRFRRCNVLQAVCTRAPRPELKKFSRVVFYLVIYGVALRPRGAHSTHNTLCAVHAIAHRYRLFKPLEDRARSRLATTPAVPRARHARPLALAAARSEARGEARGRWRAAAAAACAAAAAAAAVVADMKSVGLLRFGGGVAPAKRRAAWGETHFSALCLWTEGHPCPLSIYPLLLG